MKKIKVLISMVILLSAGTCLSNMNAQEKTIAEQEKELKIQQEIDLQKKAMADIKKAQIEEAQSVMEKQETIDDILKDIHIEVGDPFNPDGRVSITGKRGSRSFKIDDPYIFSGPDRMMESFGHSMGGDNERTTWDLSRSVKEKTFSKEYLFNVEETTNTVVMSIMGDCKAGEIRIYIIMPNGDKYSDIVIDELGNLNWRKSFNITATENQDKTGEWKFKIVASKASGYFKISAQSY